MLKPGDKIVAIDGQRFAGLGTEERLERFGETVASHKCAGEQIDGCVAETPVELRCDRNGELEDDLGPAPLRRGSRSGR